MLRADGFCESPSQVESWEKSHEFAAPWRSPVLEVLEEEQTTGSGIVLPDTAQEKPQRGRVLAVGPGERSEQTGELIPLDVAEGDEVIFSKYGGAEVKLGACVDDVLILRQSDVLAKLTSSPTKGKGKRQLVGATA